jgi:transforming growth factor-beta-induced protein
MAALHWLVAGTVVLSSVACQEPATMGSLTVEDAVEARAPESMRAASSPTIVDVAMSVNAETGEFSTLIAAVVAAGLVDALSATGQRTVFAPTDAAFAELGLDASTVGELATEVLTEILLYHVATGRRSAADVVSSDRIRMANGGFTTIRTEAGEAYINDARIVATDVEASNGLIHVIDTVLAP